MIGNQKGVRRALPPPMCGCRCVGSGGRSRSQESPPRTSSNSAPILSKRWVSAVSAWWVHIQTKSIWKQQFNFSTLITIHLVKSNHWIFLDYWMLLILSDVLSDYWQDNVVTNLKVPYSISLELRYITKKTLDSICNYCLCRKDFFSTITCSPHLLCSSLPMIGESAFLIFPICSATLPMLDPLALVVQKKRSVAAVRNILCMGRWWRTESLLHFVLVEICVCKQEILWDLSSLSIGMVRQATEERRPGVMSRFWREQGCRRWCRQGLPLTCHRWTGRRCTSDNLQSSGDEQVANWTRWRRVCAIVHRTNMLL